MGVGQSTVWRARRMLRDEGWTFAKVSPTEFERLGGPDRGTLPKASYWVVTSRPGTKAVFPLSEEDRSFAEGEVLDELSKLTEEEDRVLLRVLRVLKEGGK